MISTSLRAIIFAGLCLKTKDGFRPGSPRHEIMIGTRPLTT